MKVSLTAVVKTAYQGFECLQDQQLLFRAGNSLAIKNLNKPNQQFIPLNKHSEHLYTFKPSPNKKNIFAAEKIGKEIELVMYAFNGERKAVTLVLDLNFIADIEKIQLLTDQYDNSLLYGYAKVRDTVCAFLADFSKLKILAQGFLPAFEDIKVDLRENMSLSVCGHNGNQNYVKVLQYTTGGHWEISETIIKKVTAKVYQHELLLGSRILLIGKTSIFIMEDGDLLKKIDLAQQGEILEVIKISKGLVIRTTDDKLRLFVQDNEEVSFISAGNVALPLEEGSHIEDIRVSSNGEQVWLRTTNKDLYCWRCDNIGIQINQADLVFAKVDTSPSRQAEGTIDISSEKKYALFTGPNSVVLWNLQKAQMVLRSQFIDSIDPNKKSLFSGAISPDANSIMLAFQDKIKLYKVLIFKFKVCAEFQIKRCQSLHYSHGGQLVACKYGKGSYSSIVIINLFRLSQLCTLKVMAEPLQIFWNQLDDQLFVITEHTIQIYRVSDQAKVHHLKIQDTIVHARLDYKAKKLMVSTTHKILTIQGNTILETIAPPFLDFHYIFPLYGLYFIVGKSGMLYWSNSIRFDTAQEKSLFSEQTFQLKCRKGNLIAYSSFNQVQLLKIIRGEQRMKKASDEVVMVEKEEVLSLFEKVKDIEGRFQIMSSNYGIKIEEGRHRYEQAIEDLNKKYKKEIDYLNRKYQDLNRQKSAQEKQNQEMFKAMQKGQVRNVDDLQRMYERKCKFERQRYMDLQQKHLAQRNMYESLLNDLETRHHKTINAVREEYATKLRQQSSNINKVREVHLADKKRIQCQLFDLQEQNEFTVKEMQIVKDSEIQQLRLQIKLLQENNEGLAVKLQTQIHKSNQLQCKAQNSMEELQRLETRLKQSQNRVGLCERQLAAKQVSINERDQVIKEQGHQIAELEKAKYVLSFRTTEIRKELQPKEGLIDKLKSELMKLDDEYKALKKKNYELQQKLQKIQTINGIAKREGSDLKIALKCKERAHDELCAQIFMVVNTVDPKDWNGEFVKIYQQHIKEEKHKKKQINKKKDDTSEEIARHLMHVEQSLMHVTTGNDKYMKGKDKEVVKKMKENSQLVYELNLMRKKENQFVKERRQLQNEVAKLKRETDQSCKMTTTRTRTANTGHTRRLVQSKDFSRDRDKTIDISELSTSKRDLKKDKTRLASARRTLMMQDDIKNKSSKFFNMAKELQGARSTIMRQDRMIQELNQRLLGIPEFTVQN